MLLPKETETKASGSVDTTTTTTIIDITNDDAAEVSTVVNSSDNLMEEQQQQQQQLSVVPAEDSPKFDQYLLDTITAAVTQSSSSTSITSSMGYAPYNNFCGGNSQNTNSNGGEEMPQLLNILNELLDGQDITSLANSGGNGGIIDQEENYEDDSPRKDDPDEIARIVAQQRLEEISREEQQIQRRMDFLIRRLYKLVARSTGVHVSEEIAGFLEHVARFTKKKEKERQLSLSVASKFPFLTANLQGTSAELLKPPSVTEELPLNILSSPSTSTSTSAGATTLLTQEHQQQQQQPLSPQTDNNNTINVIEPNPIKKEEVVEEPPKPVPIHEMKSFLRRIENISNMQSTALNKRGLAFKFFTKASSNNLNQMSSLASKRYQHHQHESGSGSSSNNNFKVCAIPKLADGDVDEVEQTSGLLMTEMRLIQNQLDSDATASSTGGESADEMIPYNNQYQQPLSISKRAAFKYAKDRGAVASRWCWLATQISELDYKIRQLTDMKKHVRETKSAVTLEATGFEGQLPGNNPSRLYNVDSDSEIEGDGMTSARTRAYIGASFKKRKLVQILNLHHASKKATRPSTIKCGCNWPIQPCVLCIGRTDPTQPRECIDILPESERVALLDPAFHPVLSFPEDVPTSIHVEAICNIPEWQSKMIRSTPKSIMKHATKQLEALEGNNGRFREENKPFGIARSFAVEDVVGIGGGNGKKMKKGNIDLLTGKRKYTKRLLKGIDPTLANKIKERKKHRKRNVSLGMGPHPTRKYTFKKRIPKPEDLYPNNFSSSSSKINGLNGTDKHFDLHHRSKNSSPVPNNKTEKSSSHSRRTQNYDIDNIVIPYSIAAATKIEILSYKEIPTPKWRIISDEEQDQLCMLEEDQYAGTDETLEEDITDECMALIHDRAMMDERKKFETYLKFPLTSRSRANRRIDSRGNESSGANTPTPDATSPAPLHGDIESIPSPLLDNSTSFHENPSITALLNNINGRKERKRTLSKKDEIHDGGGSKSGSASRCISPDIKEIIPAYEPLSFPLTEVSLTRMKREMPVSRPRKSNTNAVTPKLIVAANNSTSNMSSSSTASAVTPDGKFSFISLDSNTSQHPKQITVKRSVNLSGVARPASLKKRKHNDSISESILIKEKLPTASLSSSKNNNVLIPRNKNNHNILKTIDLKKADTAALKKLMNNNNGDLINNGAKVIDFENDEDDDNDNNEVGDSDSETVTGDESPFEQDDDYVEEEEEEDSSPSETEEEEEEYLEEYDEKLYNKKKNNSSSNKFVDCHY